ncbi:MAG: UDP-N-acetylmuramoyl-L-alanyl-D-glutamate--2,6-diaminopimelate ligase, partial [Acidobacteria bacterium]
NLFIAIKGEKTDGNRFVDQARAHRASAVISEDPAPADFSGPWIQVTHSRKALAVIAAKFFGHPTGSLELVGITGTNGKTSTAYLIESIMKASRAKAGMISTIVYRGPEGAVAAERTTPESLDLQELFAGFLKQGCRYVVMEVSSHALAMDRVYASQFRSAVFTNLTPDHLDYHRTLDNYFEAKKQLFLGIGSKPPRQSVINLDDPRGKELTEVCAKRCLTYSTGSPADFRVISVQAKNSGRQIRLETPAGEWNLESRLLGRPNVSNILAAVAACYDLGIEEETIQQGVEDCAAVPGRFELIDCGQGFRVIVDYAHTEDALEKILLTARELNPRKVLLLFGCGGERDKTKRPAMGAVAEKLSHFCIITSDNPRSEDPCSIIKEIEKGFKKRPAQYLVEPDREKAIQKILNMAEAGDVVILAGKGHETYQVLADETIHCDDREVARTVLKNLGG